MITITKALVLMLVSVAVACSVATSSPATTDLQTIAPSMPDATNVGTMDPKGEQTAIFAGGCFWGVEAVFEHVKGVIDVKSGYAGGSAKTANYKDVSNGDTDHAEAVKITYDPKQVSYVQLLTIFFAVAHNPTEVDRQGPDTGRQYRSAIFYMDDIQRQLSAEYIDAINKSKALDKPIATELNAYSVFYEAEKYHQDYMVKNPNDRYIVVHDKPKVEDLKNRFPDLYVKR